MCYMCVKYLLLDVVYKATKKDTKGDYFDFNSDEKDLLRVCEAPLHIA